MLSKLRLNNQSIVPKKNSVQVLDLSVKLLGELQTICEGSFCTCEVPLSRSNLLLFFNCCLDIV